MTEKEHVALSKFMSMCLRHKAANYGLIASESGFVALHALLGAIKRQAKHRDCTLDQILEVVRTCSKQRFEISDDNTSIRCRYGHSKVSVEYDATPEEALPPFLLHGTAENVRDLILAEGLKHMGRKFVHLSAKADFASLAGRRKGKLCMLQIDVTQAQALGVQFHYGGHDVWLATDIPASCISVILNY